MTPLLVALAYRYSHIAHPTLRDVQQKLADVATVAEENIVGVHVVKAFAQEPAEEAKFTRRSDAVFQQTLRANRQRATYVPLISFVPLLAQAAVLLSARAWSRTARSARQLRRLQSLLGMLVVPLRTLGMWIGQAQRATAAGERIFEVIDEPEEVADAPGARARSRRARARSASSTCRSSTSPAGPCCAASTSSIAAGKTIALIGHTGSGKTTLTSLVPRFYDVTAGRVTLDGVDVRDVELTSLRREIGVISQDPFLFSATVRDNIAFGARRPRAEDVERAAQLAQAHEFIERLPKGYETVIGERGITLSGGQRQRIAIARALAVDPRVLILDDATASVDATTEARIRDGPARGDARTHDAHHRPPALDDRARRRDRRARRRARSPRAAPTTSCSRRAPSTARSTSTACSSASSQTRSRRAARWRTSHEGPPAGLLLRRAPRSTTGRGADPPPSRLLGG